MSNSDRQTVYDKKERNIMLKASNIRDNYPGLYDLMCKNPHFYIRDINSILDPRLREYMVIETFINIFNDTQKEWHARYNDKILSTHFFIRKNEYGECQICGKKKLKKVRFLDNVVNGAVLEVGCECLLKYKHFQFKDLNGMTRDEFIKDQKSVNQSRNREATFNQNTNGGIRAFEKIRTNYGLLPIVIPDTYFQRYLHAVGEVESIIKRFMAYELNEEAYDLFSSKMCELNGHWNSIVQYCEENKDKLWVASAEIEKWLKRKISQIKRTRNDVAGYTKALKRVKEKGVIDIVSLPYIHEESFIRPILARMGRSLSRQKASIVSHDLDNASITLNVKIRNIPVIFTVSLITFLDWSSGVIFGKIDKLNVDRFLEHLDDKVIITHHLTIENLFDWGASAVSAKGFDLKSWPELNDCIIKKNGDSFVETKIEKVVPTLFSFFVKKNEFSLYSYIKSQFDGSRPHKPISELNDLIRLKDKGKDLLSLEREQFV